MLVGKIRPVQISDLYLCIMPNITDSVRLKLLNITLTFRFVTVRSLYHMGLLHS
jgi:hypothetical protein